ncbi:MAG: heparan-alpha-glucosaminide N-acetyltransferase domain-containing protein [Bacteroidales bacterium]
MNETSRQRGLRDGSADLLKGFAVLFMVQVHIMEQLASPDTFNSLAGKISMFLGGPPCAPVFLGVMGYFLATSPKPVSYFLKRGLLLFIGGIVLNSARSANLLIRIATGEVDLDPLFFIMGADILTLAGVSMALMGVIRLVFRNNGFLYLFSAVVFVVLSPLMSRIVITGAPGFITAFLWGNQPWAYFPLFPWFAYVLVGYAFRLIQQSTLSGKINIQNQIIYFIPLWLWVFFTLPYAGRITHNLEGGGGYYHHGALFFGWVLLFMVSYAALMKLVDQFYGEQRIIQLIKWMGKKVTTLYVIQWLIIGNLATWLYKSQDLLQYIAWFTGVTLVTLLTGMFVEKIREKVSSRKVRTSG